MAKVSDQWTSRQQRHLSFISEFSTDIRHLSGRDNEVADALSRSSICSVRDGINFQEMAEDQALDDEVTASRTAITGLQLREITLSSGNTPLLCDVSTGAERPLVPVSWRRRVFDAIHGLSHPSIRSTCKLIATKFVWHGLAKQVRDCLLYTSPSPRD